MSKAGETEFIQGYELGGLPDNPDDFGGVLSDLLERTYENMRLGIGSQFICISLVRAGGTCSVEEWFHTVLERHNIDTSGEGFDNENCPPWLMHAGGTRERRLLFLSQVIQELRSLGR